MSQSSTHSALYSEGVLPARALLTTASTAVGAANATAADAADADNAVAAPSTQILTQTQQTLCSSTSPQSQQPSDGNNTVVVMMEENGERLGPKEQKMFSAHTTATTSTDNSNTRRVRHKSSSNNTVSSEALPPVVARLILYDHPWLRQNRRRLEEALRSHLRSLPVQTTVLSSPPPSPAAASYSSTGSGDGNGAVSAAATRNNKGNRATRTTSAATTAAATGQDQSQSQSLPALSELLFFPGFCLDVTVAAPKLNCSDKATCGNNNVVSTSAAAAAKTANTVVSPDNTATAAFASRAALELAREEMGEAGRPLYAQEFKEVLEPLATTRERQARQEEERETRRRACFNCGHVGHAVTACPKPLNTKALAQGRARWLADRDSSSSSISTGSSSNSSSNRNYGGGGSGGGGRAGAIAARYHFSGPRVRAADIAEQERLKRLGRHEPGLLSDVLRAALGVPPNCVPVHVQRMANGLGYPPSWRGNALARYHGASGMVFVENNNSNSGCGSGDAVSDSHTPVSNGNKSLIISADTAPSTTSGDSGGGMSCAVDGSATAEPVKYPGFNARFYPGADRLETFRNPEKNAIAPPVFGTASIAQNHPPRAGLVLDASSSVAAAPVAVATGTEALDVADRLLSVRETRTNQNSSPAPQLSPAAAAGAGAELFTSHLEDKVVEATEKTDSIGTSATVRKKEVADPEAACGAEPPAKRAKGAILLSPEEDLFSPGAADLDSNFNVEVELAKIFAVLRGQRTDVKEVLALLEGRYRYALATASDSEGITALHVSAACGRMDTAKRLLALGAGVGYRTKRGDTPLHYACFGGHVGMVDVLRAAGADTTAVTDDGFTPKQLAGAYPLVLAALERKDL